jgi:DNA adenine methylase Dam
MSISPIIKWPGGKARLLPLLRQGMPTNLHGFTQYVEPFLGGGALFLEMLGEGNFAEYLVSDSNPRLMNLYDAVRDTPAELMMLLDVWEREYLANSWAERSKVYYRCRERFNKIPAVGVESAALFIYLNKTCFNGLYRENKSGGFNAPFGKYENPRFYDRSNIMELSRKLGRRSGGKPTALLRCGDFLALEDSIADDAFVYLDPPYHPIGGVGYTTYKLDDFNQESQVALRDLCVRLDRRGVKWLLSNSDPHNIDADQNFLDDLYASYNIRRVVAPRSIGAAGGTRKKISELLISNY